MSSDVAAPRPARDQLILDHLPLVDAIARRYAGRGEPLDDLVQAGSIGLVKSARRFDPGRGVAFATYAAPTISGEIKRHFRDRGWAVHVPRRLKDLSLRLVRRSDELATAFGRMPTLVELAAAEGVSVLDVTEALGAAHAYTARSLSQPSDDREDGASLIEAVGSHDPGFRSSELRADLEPALAVLEPRERRIIVLRYRDGLVQAQIARRMGISQMHVSRLARRSLTKLRQALEDPASERSDQTERRSTAAERRCIPAERRSIPPAA